MVGTATRSERARRAARTWKRFSRTSSALVAVSALRLQSAFAAEASGLRWDAPDGCPSQASVVARTHSTAQPSGVPLEEGIAVDVRVAPRAAGPWRARVVVVADGAETERWLEATSCDAIADAVALIVGLSAVSSPPLAPPMPPPRTPPRSSLAAAASPPPPWRGPQGLSARVGAIADAGSLPSAAPGVGLGLTWRLPPLGLDFEAASFVAQRGLLAAIPQEGATIGMTYGAFDACLSVPPADRVVMEACVGVGFEFFTSKGVGPKGAFSPASPAPAFAPSAVGELGLEWWPLERIGLRVAARGMAPLARRTFFIEGGGDVFTPAVAIEPYVGLAVSLTK